MSERATDTDAPVMNGSDVVSTTGFPAGVSTTPRQRRTALRAIDSSFRPVLALMSGRTVGFAASFLIPVALARILDQSEFGTYKQLFLIAGTLYGMGQLGMAESLFYFLPRGGSRDGSRYVANSVAALALGGLLCFALLSLEGGLVANWLGNPALADYTAPLGIYLGLMIASAGLEIVMIARKRYPLASWAYAALDVTRAGLLVLPALVIPGLSGLLTGAIVFAAVRCSVAAWYLRREFHEDGVRPDATLFRAQLAYAAPFALAGLVEIAQTSFHQYFVAYRTDPASFAIYAVGCLQIPLVEVATASVLNVMMVRMSEHLGAGRESAAVHVWHDSTRKLALLFLPMVAFLVVAAHPIITLLFTERYAASVPVFVVSTLGLLLPVIAVDAVLRVHADTRVLFGLNVLRLILTVALIGPFIERFGLAGAVLATVTAAAVAKAVGLARIARSMRLSLSGLLPWSGLARIALAALIAATAAGVAELETSVPIAALLVGGAVFGAAYLACVWALGALSESERKSVRSLIGRVWPVRATRPEA